MLRLFPLISLSIILVQLLSIVTFAASGEVRTNLSENKNQLFITSPTIARYFTISTSYSSIQTENTNRLIPKHEQADLGISIEANGQTDQVRLNHNQVVSNSVSAYKTYELLYAHYLYSKTSAVGFQLSQSTQNQPYQTFIHPLTAVTTVRPLTLNSRSVELFYEQVLSEQMRGRYSLLSGQVNQDRPSYLGLEARHAYALNNQTFLRLDTGIISDNQNYQLKDDRGYFSTSWGEFSVAIQPRIEWTFEFGAGTVIEKEFQPSILITNALTQIGTDSYFLKTTYQGSQWQLSFLFNQTINNLNQNSNTVSGEFTWEI